MATSGGYRSGIEAPRSVDPCSTAGNQAEGANIHSCTVRAVRLEGRTPRRYSRPPSVAGIKNRRCSRRCMLVGVHYNGASDGYFLTLDSSLTLTTNAGDRLRMLAIFSTENSVFASRAKTAFR
jgi:hypothetical protein